MPCDNKTIEELQERVAALEQFCDLLAQEIEAEDDDMVGVLEAYHQAFTQRAKRKVGG